MTIAWTIAGSDSGGFSGIQADLIVFKNFNVRAASIITAITAQNKESVNSIYHLPSEQIIAQFNTQTRPHAIKIGMLGCDLQIALLINYLSENSCIVILDPIFFSTSGYALFNGNIDHYLASLKQLLPYVTLLTPNIHEAELLTQKKIITFSDMKQACQQILSMGVKNVLMKGGHSNDQHFSQDLWTDGKEYLWLSSKRHKTEFIRGTGCTFSSAITACLANNFCMKDAIIIAKMYISQYIRTNRFHNTIWNEDQSDLPSLNLSPITDENPSFPRCDYSIGLYPIVDSFKWLETLLPLGIRTIQLRIKNKIDLALENEIIDSIKLAKQFGAQLFINDYWQLAVKHGAYGVHLGQEDLEYADVNAIRKAGLRLGISTHSYFEVARAHALKPSYIAYGPIFATTSKVMLFAPQGLVKLKHWCKLLDYPIVAIGGIDKNNFEKIKEAGVDGIAMISAILQANNPIAAAKDFLNNSQENTVY